MGKILDAKPTPFDFIAARALLLPLVEAGDVTVHSANALDAAALALCRHRLFGELKGERSWKPISTAPKDGTFILLAITGGKDGSKVHEAYWHKGDDRWDADWWLAATGPGDYTAGPISEIMHGTPTHWRPKPTALEARP